MSADVLWYTQRGLCVSLHFVRFTDFVEVQLDVNSSRVIVAVVVSDSCVALSRKISAFNILKCSPFDVMARTRYE